MVGQEILLVDHVDQEGGRFQPVLGHDELLEVVDGEGAGALEEPPVRVLLLQPARATLLQLLAFAKKY